MESSLITINSIGVQVETDQPELIVGYPSREIGRTLLLLTMATIVPGILLLLIIGPDWTLIIVLAAMVSVFCYLVYAMFTGITRQIIRIDQHGITIRKGKLRSWQNITLVYLDKQITDDGPFTLYIECKNESDDTEVLFGPEASQPIEVIASYINKYHRPITESN